MAKNLVDVYGRQVPRWVLRVQGGPAAMGAAETEMMTSAQRRQLGFYTPATPSSSSSSTALFPSRPVVEAMAARDRACLAHSRPNLVVHRSRGDVVFSLDYQHDYLNIAGEALTRDAGALHRLGELTAARAYTLPFWVTRGEVEAGAAADLAWSRMLFGHSVLNRLPELFSDDQRCVVLPDHNRCVVNLAEICAPFLAATRTATEERKVMLVCHFCRQFRPIRFGRWSCFDASVAERLRFDCFTFHRWCSLWGTADDYASHGIEVLEGAISVPVFDALGDELQLIPALATKDVAAAYCEAYPECSILLVD